MNQLPGISIICPVYKAESYLHKCVDSILAQTFTDWELILVDDGSPDTSGTICDDYAANDSRIRVIHKQNGGVSSARQAGLDSAQGEYVIHSDPDDWVEPTMLEELYAKAISEDADMVICDFYVNSGDIQTYRKQEPTALDHITIMNELFVHLHGSCWNKLVRRSCFEKYSVQFTPWLSFCEDLCLNVQLLKFNIKVTYVPKAYYHYVVDVNGNSIVKKLSYESLSYDLQVYELLDKITREYPAHDLFERQYSRTCTIRAFRSGLLSNRVFKDSYGRFANYVWNRKSLSPSNILLYLSCKGLYRVCYFINRYIGNI